MKVLLFGATGMVGGGVLLACLDAADVQAVTAVGRRPSGRSHAKLRELVMEDMHDYRGVEAALTGFDACFFCLGVSSAGITEAEYARQTEDLTLAAATTLARLNPDMIFVYVSGAGTDSSERGRSIWARVKGRTENRLLRAGFRAAYMFRPGLIAPVRGVRSKTRLYRFFYALLGPVLPLLRRAWPDLVLATEQIGRAMLTVARTGAPKAVLESRDLRLLAEVA